MMLQLIGSVNNKMLRKFAEELEGIPDPEQGEEAKPIQILVCTEGGDFYIALAIYDLLRFKGKKHPIRIIASGVCMSAGTIILQAGTTRYATRTCQFMVHYGTASFDDDAAKMKAAAAHEESLKKVMQVIYNRRAKVQPRAVKSWLNKEKFFSAEEALKVGLIDGILA